MNYQTAFWLILALVLGAFEASTSTLITIWPAIAALFTALFASLGVKSPWLAVIFIVFSAILLACTRPLVKKYVGRKSVATNADRIIGMDGLVIQTIDPSENSGQIKIMGQIWSAKSRDGKIIEKDCSIKVVALEGVKAVVEPKQ